MSEPAPALVVPAPTETTAPDSSPESGTESGDVPRIQRGFGRRHGHYGPWDDLDMEFEDPAEESD